MNKKTQLPVVIQEKESTPMSLLQLAITSNADMDKLQRLMDMQKEWNAQKAKEAFFEALSAFQEDCPEIKKIRKVNYTSKRTQESVNYRFANLGDIEKQIKAAMRKHGLSKRWEISENGKMITLSCLITHKLGHTERTVVSGELDDSGSKNNIQQKGSTISYLERYSLIAALGISTADTDDDGRSAKEGVDLPMITEERFNNALKKVMDGSLTLDTIFSQVRVNAEQKKALENADKSRKK